MADSDEKAIIEARKAMIAKRFGGNETGARTGGGGSVRRKTKGAHKSLGDDKKLGGVLKKMALTNINGVEEVNIFKSDGMVIKISAPKIQASIPSNTYVVSGSSETKKLEDFLPGILNQLGPESMEYLRKYAEAYSAGKPSGTGNSATINEVDEEEEEDDDEVPDLVENFEEAAAK
eukprot:gene6027-8299_t